MSTDIATTRNFTVTQFMGGEERGLSLQITPRNTPLLPERPTGPGGSVTPGDMLQVQTYVQLTREDVAELVPVLRRWLWRRRVNAKLLLQAAAGACGAAFGVGVVSMLGGFGTYGVLLAVSALLAYAVVLAVIRSRS